MKSPQKQSDNSTPYVVNKLSWEIDGGVLVAVHTADSGQGDAACAGRLQKNTWRKKELKHRCEHWPAGFHPMELLLLKIKDLRVGLTPAARWRPSGYPPSRSIDTKKDLVPSGVVGCLTRVKRFGRRRPKEYSFFFPIKGKEGSCISILYVLQTGPGHSPQATIHQRKGI